MAGPKRVLISTNATQVSFARGSLVQAGWFFLALLCSAAHGTRAYAQADGPKILFDTKTRRGNYLPDFSYAGYGFGLGKIPKRRGKVIDVTRYGAKPGDDVDDSAAVLRALAAAHKAKGPVVVRFPAGRFILSEVLYIERGDFVLQGAGRGKRGGTTLYFPRPLRVIDKSDKLTELRKFIVEGKKRQLQPRKNLDVFFSEYSWTGGVIWVERKNARSARYLDRYDRPIQKICDLVSGRRGERKVLAREPSAVRVGDVVQVHWFNPGGKKGAILRELYGPAPVKIGSNHWNWGNQPLVIQTTKIAELDGERVTLADPLLHNITERLPAQLSVWKHMREVGIEDLHIEFPDMAYAGHHLEEGYNGIHLAGVFNGWVRSVRVTNADAGIVTYDSANVTIRDVTTEGGERGAHYSVHVGNVHNVLVDGLMVFNPVIHSLSFNTQATRSVYTNAHVFQRPALDQHAGVNHQNLFDAVTVYAQARRKGKTASYPIFSGGGDPLWLPRHAAFNTTWNLKLIVEAGANPRERVLLEGANSGPMARIVGIHGNRHFDLDYRPRPYTERMNHPMTDVPSLYRYQLEQRRKEAARP